MASRLLRLETFAFLSLVLVGSLLPMVMFETVKDAGQRNSLLQDYSLLFKSFSPGGDNFDWFGLEEEDKYSEEEEEDDSGPEIFTILKNRKELESSQLFSLATNWRPSFHSNRCQALLQSSLELAKTGSVGSGARPSCTQSTTFEQPLSSFLNSAQATVHVSMTHRIVYVPSISMFRIKAFYGFERAIKKRFHTKQVPERLLPLYFKHLKLNASDFFVFTLVQHPAQHFVASYNLLKVNTSREAGFESSPQSALLALQQSQAALAPKPRAENSFLLFSQVFKTMRCIPHSASKRFKDQLVSPKTVLEFDFVGRVENLEHDWRYIEAVLGVPHVPLQWGGGLYTLKHKRHGRNPHFDEVDLQLFNSTEARPVRVLEEEQEEGEQEQEEEEEEEEVKEEEAPEEEPATTAASVAAKKQFKEEFCRYYKADFECFGYDDSICD